MKLADCLPDGVVMLAGLDETVIVMDNVTIHNKRGHTIVTDKAGRVIREYTVGDFLAQYSTMT